MLSPKRVNPIYFRSSQSPIIIYLSTEGMIWTRKNREHSLVPYNSYKMFGVKLWVCRLRNDVSVIFLLYRLYFSRNSLAYDDSKVIPNCALFPQLDRAWIEGTFTTTSLLANCHVPPPAVHLGARNVMMNMELINDIQKTRSHSHRLFSLCTYL